MSDSLVRVSRRAEWGAHEADAGSTRMPRHAETARAAYHDRVDGVSAGISTARALAAAAIRIGQRPEPIGGPACDRSTSDRGASPAPIRFPPDNFKHSLTLFSKSFSSFPRGTCLLSPWTEFTARLGLHSQTTRLADGASWCDGVRAQRGSHPLRRHLPVDLGPVRRRGRFSGLQFGRHGRPILKLGYSRFARRY
ncbi:unnamed protein product [Prunus brigantina]